MLESAHQRQEYQVINEVEVALGIGPFGYSKRLSTAPYPDIDKFNKTMAKVFSVESGKNLLPYATNLRKFFDTAHEKTSKPLTKYKPEEFIYIPFISKIEISNAFESLLNSWNQLPASVKKIDTSGEYSDSDIVTGIINQIYKSFYVAQTDSLKANQALLIQAIQNRTLGGLVFLIHKMAPLPRLKIELKLQIASNQSYLKCEAFQRRTENPSQVRHFPTAQEVYSAGILAATLSDCGGVFAGPEFLFSGNLKPEKLNGKIAPSSDKTHAEIAHSAKSHSLFFDELFKHKNTMVSRSHNS